MNILFVNACVREDSRTLALAREILKEKNGNVTELVLRHEGLKPIDQSVIEKRNAICGDVDESDAGFKYATQFAQADEIVIAAPFWDLGFPSILKIYLEHITVAKITFKYENGISKGLCKAKKLTYVTTSGGNITHDFGYTYIKTLAKEFYGIDETVAYRVMNTDVECMTVNEVLDKARLDVIM